VDNPEVRVGIEIAKLRAMDPREPRL